MTGKTKHKILLTGGSGRLGTELQKYLKCDAPTHQELDITKTIKWSKDYDLIIHCAGYTDVAKAEKEPEECYKVNFFGLFNIAKYFESIPFVNISTEYVKNPRNVYSWSKKAGEGILREPYLNIRTLFKARPYPYDEAWINQYTQGDYVDIIAPMIVVAIRNWDKITSKTIEIGTGRKSIFELARMSKPKIKEKNIYLADLQVALPADYK